MTEMFLIVVVIVLQFILLRKNPTAKASILWIGLSVLLGAGAFVVLNVAPIIFKVPQLDQGIGFSFFLLIYAGIAAGITQYRLFEVEKWAFRFLFYALGSLFLVLVDALLIYVLGFDQVPAFGISIFLVSVTYLPLRDSLTRRLFRQSRMGSDETLRIALHVAFAPNPTIRAERWKSSLIEIFNLLQLETVDFNVDVPSIENNGVSLLVPSVANFPNLRLSHLDLGRKLFNKQSLKLVEQLLALIQEAESSRSAYDRGVNEERQRMAQDLHDDLGARLLTCLYEADEKLKPTLQGAIADIRAIVSGLSESKNSLSKLLADLRYETLRRFEASNVICEWNIVNVRSDDLIIEYELHRTISSTIREIISNVIRHANATRLIAMITIEMNQIFISIEDNGKGMAVDVVNGSKPGHGLKILRKRVASCSGSIEIRSDERGTEFLIKIPI